MPGDSTDLSDSSDASAGDTQTSDAPTSDAPGDERPSPPDLPAYVVDPLDRQSPERLDAIATYARRLAEHKRGPEQSADAVSSEREHLPDSTESGTRVQESERTRSAVTEESDRRRAVTDAELESLSERGVSTDPAEYEAVPDDGAYVTIKETKPGYRYYYWQWRDGDTWRNQYIGPVSRDE